MSDKSQTKIIDQNLLGELVFGKKEDDKKHFKIPMIIRAIISGEISIGELSAPILLLTCELKDGPRNGYLDQGIKLDEITTLHPKDWIEK